MCSPGPWMARRPMKCPARWSAPWPRPPATRRRRSAGAGGAAVARRASYDQFKDFEHRGDVFRAAGGAAAADAQVEGGIMSISRADKGGFANWWFTVDKVALLGMGVLIGIGLMLAFAASPAITGGPLTAGDFRYAARQIGFRRHCAGDHGRRLAAVAAPDQDHGGGASSPPRWSGPSWCCLSAPMCWGRGANSISAS